MGDNQKNRKNVGTDKLLDDIAVKNGGVVKGVEQANPAEMAFEPPRCLPYLAVSPYVFQLHLRIVCS